MKGRLRGKRIKVVQVRGIDYTVELVETPFREGVEAVCSTFTPPIRVSDRGLGDHEALRLIALQIEKRLA